MPIYVPQGLPAASILRREGIAACEGEPRGPALAIALLNLMPDKLATETQFARMLGAGDHAVRLTLLAPQDHEPKNTPARHLAAFYRTWPEIRGQAFDGLIVTGAPLEHLAFEAVDYWSELTAILDWAWAGVSHSLFVCWAAQAALHHRHGVPKHLLPQKAFGVFRQQALARAPVLAGLEDGFDVPVSRHTTSLAADLPAGRGLAVLAACAQSGLCLVQERGGRDLYMFNHLEYDADTLAREYRRDLAEGAPIALPRHYFPGDDPAAEPVASWRPAALRFFGNWLGAIAAGRLHLAA